MYKSNNTFTRSIWLVHCWWKLPHKSGFSVTNSTKLNNNNNIKGQLKQVCYCTKKPLRQMEVLGTYQLKLEKHIQLQAKLDSLLYKPLTILYSTNSLYLCLQSILQIEVTVRKHPSKSKHREIQNLLWSLNIRW